MARENEWLRVVYGEAARKLAERDDGDATGQSPQPAEPGQRQSARKSEYSGSSPEADDDAGAARPL